MLCVMKADGTGLRQITRDGSIAIDPHFSPDGKTILFWSDDGLYTVATDGSRPPSPLGGLDGRDAVYSPDGRSIAFSMGQYAPDQRIFVARADGTELRRLAHPAEGHPRSRAEDASDPPLRPTGSESSSSSNHGRMARPAHAKESLWEMDVDGGHPREIAGYGLFDDPLNWRPRPPIQKRGP